MSKEDPQPGDWFRLEWRINTAADGYVRFESGAMMRKRRLRHEGVYLGNGDKPQAPADPRDAVVAAARHVVDRLIRNSGDEASFRRRGQAFAKLLDTIADLDSSGRRDGSDPNRFANHPLSGHACYIQSCDDDLLGLGVVVRSDDLQAIRRHNAAVQIEQNKALRRRKQNEVNQAARRRNAERRS